jgi:hypothetical protein
MKKQLVNAIKKKRVSGGRNGCLRFKTCSNKYSFIKIGKGCFWPHNVQNLKK